MATKTPFEQIFALGMKIQNLERELEELDARLSEDYLRLYKVHHHHHLTRDERLFEDLYLVLNPDIREGLNLESIDKALSAIIWAKSTPVLA